MNLISTVPADGATGVAVDQIVSATVDEDLYGYDSMSFVVRGGGTDVFGEVDFVPSTKQLLFVPIEQYRGNTGYTVYIGAAITNGAGYPLGVRQWSFTTGDDTLAPRIFQTSPIDGAMGATAAVIYVQFDEPVTGVDTTTFVVSAGATGVAGTITSGGTGAQDAYVFTPSMSLPPNDTITVSLAAPIQDLAGNLLAPTGFSFTTGP